MERERSSEERGQPSPHAEELPIVKAVTPDGEHAAAIAPHRRQRGEQRLPGWTWMHGIWRAAQDEHARYPGDDGENGNCRERATPVGELERKPGHAERDSVARARARDEVTHGAAAARALDVLVDQRERRRIRAALAKPGRGVQPERRPEAVGEEHEGPRAKTRGDAGRDVGALRAEVIGDKADDEERGEIAEVKRGLDHASSARAQDPREL